MQVPNFKVELPEGINLFPGVYVFIIKESPALTQVKQYFGRVRPLCLKVFRKPLQGDIEDYTWGHPLCVEEHKSLLVEATKVQNICAASGLAPRVYALVTLEIGDYKYPAQLTDFVDDSSVKRASMRSVYEKVKQVCIDNHCTPPAWDNNEKNTLNNMWIDFQGAKLLPDYKDFLRTFVEDNAWFVEGTHYQTQPELELPGWRDSEKRVRDLQLDVLNFEGKDVLDIGCCGGFFCNYAASRGARRVVGVDYGQRILAAKYLSNYLGYFNIDYVDKAVGEDESEFARLKSFNIVLHLAVYWYIGMPKWCADMTKDILICEKNGKEEGHSDEEVFNRLQSLFPSVEEIGGRSDFDGQPLYLCKK